MTITAVRTISEQLAQEAREFKFSDLPPEVVHEAKRRVLDALACAIAGFDSPPSRALQAMLDDVGGPPESTVFGSGRKTSCANATLVNGVMLRFAEAMDLSLEATDGVTFNGHPGEIIPSVIAVGERERATGQEALTAIVLGYQLLNRLAYAMNGCRPIEHNGWKNEIRAGLVVPLVAGRLMRLTDEQIVNAVGISGCYTAALGLTDHGSEEVTMARELRFPHNAYNGVLAALMARRGFEGPRQVYEGHNGFLEVMFRDKADVERITRRDGDFNIMYTWTKSYPVNIRLLGIAEILIRLTRRHDLRPEAIRRVRITTTPRVLEGMGNPGTHKYPATKQTADQSAYYVAALAIVDRDIVLNLEQFTPERLKDPALRRVIDTIELVAVPEWTMDFAPTEIEVTTTGGRVYRDDVVYPRGHPKNALTDAELEAKFLGMANRMMSEAQRRAVCQAVWGLDQMRDLSELTSHLRVSS